MLQEIFTSETMTIHIPEKTEIRQLRAEYKKQAFLGDVLYPCVVGEDQRTIVSLQDQAGKAYATVEFDAR